MKNVDPKVLLDFAKEKSLVEVVLYYWLGRWVEENERKILEEMMVLSVDHGNESPSAVATIETSKGGKDLLRSVEAGVGEINEKHGGAIEGLARILREDEREASEIVKDYLEREKRLPGFGHRVYKDEDPRVTYLEQRAKSLGIRGKYFGKVREIELELDKQKGKKLPVNIDGAMAAILTDMGVEPKLMNGFFLWPRVAGLIYRAGVGKVD